MPARKKTTPPPAPEAYSHPTESSPARPEIGAQAHFKKTKAPAKYRYDSSLAPEIVWDEGNPAREDAEKLIAELPDHGLKLAELAMQEACKERDAEIQRLEKAIREARRSLSTISGAFLNWTGKAERPSFEATIPTAEGLDEDPVTPGIQSEEYQDHVIRMIEVLRKSPVLRLPKNETVTLKQIRPPAKTLGLSAEALVEGSAGVPPAVQEGSGQDARATLEPVAILFGPETGPISERFVREAWDEAGLKRYSRLFVIGFGIDPKAREFIDNAGKLGIPAFYLQATMDLQMGDLLNNMRSSHVFSVCGLPDVKVIDPRGNELIAVKKLEVTK